ATVVIRPPLGTALPASATVCGLPASESAIFSVPFRVPVVDGVNVTFMAQFAPAASDAPQLSVSEKSPVIVMAATLSAVLLLFVRLIVFGPAVAPSAAPAKLKLEAERLT